MKKLLGTVTIGMAALLAACGGGGGSGEQTLVVNRDVSVPVDATVATAVLQVAFTFPNGVSAFGTSAPTTVSFMTATATPSFSITESGEAATGTATLNPCTFTLTASTFPATSPLALGKTVALGSCALALRTTGMAADGAAQGIAASLVLGATRSADTSASVAVAPTGALTVNGIPLNVVVPIAPLTGA